MIRMLTHNYARMYIYKEKGNLYVKDKGKNSRPIEYAVYDNDRNPIGLRDYMSIRGIDIHKALGELESCNVVFVGHIFEINFYTEEDSNKFVDMIEGFNK